MKFNSITSRLIVAYFLFSLILIASIGFFALSFYEQHIEEDTYTQLNNNLDMKKQLMDAWVFDSVEETLYKAKRVSELYGASELLSAEEITASSVPRVNLQNYLATSAESNRIISTFEVADSRGRIIASSNPHNLAKNLSRESYFKKGLTDTHVTRLYYIPDKEQASITITTPLLYNNSTAGVMISHLNMSILDEILMHNSMPSLADETYLVQTDGTRLMPSSGGKDVQRIESEGISQALLGNDGKGRYASHDGIPVFGAYRWLDPYGAAIIEEVHVDKALLPITVLKTNLVRLGSILILLTLIGIFLISLTITSPLASLLSAIKSAKETGAAKTISPAGPLETRLLAENFNELNSSINKTLGTLQIVMSQFELITSNISMGLQLFDNDLNRLYQNKWIAEHSVKQGGDCCYELLWGKHTWCEECPVKKTLASGQLEQKTAVQELNRQKYHLCMTAHPLKDVNGNIIGVLEIIRDVTREQQVEQQLREYRDKLSLLLDASYTLSSKITPEETYNTIVRTAKEALKSDYASLLLVEGNTLVMEASEGFPPGLKNALRFNRGEGLCTHVLETKKPGIVSDYRDETRFTVPEIIVDEKITSSAAAPILWGEAAIGVLSLHSKAKRVFSKNELCILQTLSNYAAAAIKRAEHYNTQQQRAEQIAGLLRASEIINSQLDELNILRHLTEEAVKITESTAGAAGFYKNGVFTVKQYYTKGTWIPIDYSFRAGEGVPGWVIRHRKTYISNDAINDPHTVPEIVKELDFTKLLAVPVLNSTGELLAIFQIHNKKGKDFTNTDAHLLTALANQAAIALENSTSMREITTRQQELELIHEVSRSFRTDDQEQGLNQCLSHIIDFFGYVSGYIQILDENTRKLILTAHRNMSTQWVQDNGVVNLEECADGTLISDKKTIVFEPPVSSTTGQAGKGVGSAVCVPLVVEHEVVGMMNFSKHEGDLFTEQEADLLELLGEEIGMYIDDVSLHDRFEKIAAWVKLIKEIPHCNTKYELLSLISKGLVNTMKVHRCLVYLTENKNLVLEEEYTLIGEPLKNSTRFSESTAFHRALLYKEPVIFNDARDEKIPILLSFKKTIRALNIKSLILAPLNLKGREQGVIALHDCEDIRQWQRGDIDFLKTLTNIMSIRLQGIEQEELVKKQSFTIERLKREKIQTKEELKEEIMHFNESAHALLSTKETGEIASTAINLACSLTDSALGQMHLVRGKGVESFFYALNPQCNTSESETLNGVNGYVLRTRKPLRIRDLSSFTQNKQLPPDHFEIGAFMGVPVLWKGELLADLLVARKPGENPFTKEDEQILCSVAELTVLALRNTRYAKNLEKRLDELEQLNRLTVKRELKMIELKKQIQQLKEQQLLGKGGT